MIRHSIIILTIALTIFSGTAVLADEASVPPTAGHSVQKVNSWATGSALGGNYNITIIESQSSLSGHDMDVEWEAIALGMGHSATIVPQNTLDDISNLSGTDILIVSSGVIDLPANSVQTIMLFLQEKGPVYLQGEFLCDLSSNLAFMEIVTTMGGSFASSGIETGNLVPMNVLGDLAMMPNSVPTLPFFWYGCAGSGDATIEPFLEFEGNYFGFIFTSPMSGDGKLIYTTDQDWVKDCNLYPESTALVGNILQSLAAYVPVANDAVSFGEIKALYR